MVWTSQTASNTGSKNDIFKTKKPLPWLNDRHSKVDFTKSFLDSFLGKIFIIGDILSKGFPFFKK
jgi:hypothetical protein